MNGEYALEIYANDPARDGNTYTHVCQYLLVKPNKGDATAGAAYNAPEYRECYNVHGMKEPFNRPNMSLEQLARGMLTLLSLCMYSSFYLTSHIIYVPCVVIGQSLCTCS